MIIAIFWILFALAAILPVRWVVYFFFIGLAFGTFKRKQRQVGNDDDECGKKYRTCHLTGGFQDIVFG